MLSFTEENYLKALFQLQLNENDQETVGTNKLASHLNIKPATANDMLKKLKEKCLVEYEKYGKIAMTALGRKHAIEVLRKHRLWETFLFEKLEFTWDEVHEVAEQLEHIQSQKLVNKLEQFLGFPQFDPHGDFIPNAKGEFKIRFKKTLAEVRVGESCKMAAVKDNSVDFLKYVMKVGIKINHLIKVLSQEPYDELIEIEVHGKRIKVGHKFAQNIFVVCENCEVGKPCPNNEC